MKSKETNKERLLRQGLIFLCFGAVAAAFIWQNNLLSKKGDTFFYAEVLQVGNNEQPPLVAVAESVEGKPGLLIYEIDKDDNYQFQTKLAEELPSTPEKLEVVDETLYLQIDKDYYYLNDKNKLEHLDEQPQIRSSTIAYELIENQKGYHLEISSQGTEKVFQLEDRPKDVQLLNEDPHLWLIIFDKKVSILSENADNYN